MTNTERKYKKAFMALLEDYRGDVWERAVHNYCHGACPFMDMFDIGCPGRVQGHECGIAFADYNYNRCREAIFKWYVEKANGCLRD